MYVALYALKTFCFLVFRTCFFVKNEIDMFSDGYVQCCHLLCVVKLIERLNTPVFGVGICTKSVLVCCTVEPVFQDKSIEYFFLGGGDHRFYGIEQINIKRRGYNDRLYCSVSIPGSPSTHFTWHKNPECLLWK